MHCLSLVGRLKFDMLPSKTQELPCIISNFQRGANIIYSHWGVAMDYLKRDVLSGHLPGEGCC